ncbi:general stress protein [Pantanalinema sp. GBBB05]|uniref:general stress protein n=1 Tax=Pantanalinema sp. GBBB05 TaxID=2604139 RepID=UPI001E18D6EE|nr:histidine kinase [Pantanalinema sp. GBBB05]
MVQTNPVTGKHQRSVGVFPTRRAAERALHELRDSGFPMDRVSVITQDRDQPDQIAGADVRDRTGNKADEGATVGALSGGALGGLTGLLVGLGTLAIPGIGPIMLAGATATALATTLAGGAIGAVTGGLLGALIGLGIPEERARVYHDRVARGEYLVIVDGSDAEIRRAEAILHRGGIEEYGVYDAPVHATHASPVATTGVATPTTREVTGTPFGRRYAVGVFPHLQDAEFAVDDLRNSGLPLSQISLVANNFQRRDRFSGIDLRDRFEAMRFGIPAEQARLYHDRLDRGDYMVIVNGTEAELGRAESILHHRGIQDWRIYDPTDVSSTTQTSTFTTPGVATFDRESVSSSATPLTSSTPLPVTSTTGTSHPVGYQHKRAIGVFSHRREAEAALTDLRDSGFPMDRVSLIAKHTGTNDQIAGVGMQSTTGNKADEGAKAGAVTGGALGGLGGLLIGLGTLAIPGVGPVLLGGATATALATALSGGAIGAVAGGITGALVGLGIPEERAKVYNDRLAKGDYLVMIDGSDTEANQAEAILRRHHIHEWNIFDASDGNRHHSAHDTSEYRHTAPDVESTRRESDTSIGHSTPDVTIIDRRDETRR